MEVLHHITIPLTIGIIHNSILERNNIRKGALRYENDKMVLIGGTTPRWRKLAALCVVAINIISMGDQRKVFSTAEASTPGTVSIPSQIMNAKIPTSNDQNQQLWLYEGALYDPLDGRQVAKVQGLELVQQLDDTSHLAIDKLLKHPNATYQDSKTIWSQKIFCYTTTKNVGKEASSSYGTVDRLQDKSKTQESILDSVRVRPRSPRKEVPLDQAVAVYETATTFVSRKDRKTKNRNSNKQGSDDIDDVEVLVHSEWPNGQTIWGKAQDCSQQIGKTNSGNDSDSNTIDFTIFAKLRNKNSPLYSPNLIRGEESQDETRTTKNGDIIVSPKRASLVQFGSSDGTMETKHKYGARETYSYRNVPKTVDSESNKSNNLPKWFSLPWKNSKTKDPSSTSPTVYYTRYGEGPPFYAPGRMCMLELRGRPVSNFGEVGPLLKGLIKGESSGKQKPPISNFHWKDKIVASQEDDKRRRNEKEGVEIDSNNNPSNISIQAAWNLRERNRELGTDGSESNPKAKVLPKRRRRTSQPLALRLDVPDETIVASTNGKGNFGVLLKRGKNCAVAMWSRIKDSSTMESRS